MAATTTGGQYYETKVIAQLFNVSVRRIQQLTQDGVLETVKIPDGGRRYDLVPTIQAYTKYLSEKAYGKQNSEREAELRQQKLTAEIALKESQGELHQLKTAIAAGRYIAVEEVTLDYQRFFVTFKKFALALPSRLMDYISTYVDPLEGRRIEKAIQQEVQNLLGAFVVAGVVTEPPPKPSKPAETAPENGGVSEDG